MTFADYGHTAVTLVLLAVVVYREILARQTSSIAAKQRAAKLQTNDLEEIEAENAEREVQNRRKIEEVSGQDKLLAQYQATQKERTTDLKSRLAELEKTKQEADLCEKQHADMKLKIAEYHAIFDQHVKQEQELSVREQDLQQRMKAHEELRVHYERQRMEISAIRSDMEQLETRVKEQLSIKHHLVAELRKIESDTEDLKRLHSEKVEEYALLGHLDDGISKLREQVARGGIALDDMLVPPLQKDADTSLICPRCWQKLNYSEKLLTPRLEWGRLTGLFKALPPVPKNKNQALAFPDQPDKYMLRLEDAGEYFCRPEVNAWCESYLPRWSTLSEQEKMDLLFEGRCPNRPCWTGLAEDGSGIQMMGRAIPLPASETLRIALVGASHSGKSAFAGVLLHELLTGKLHPYGLSTQADSASFSDIESMISRLYTDKVVVPTDKDTHLDIAFDVTPCGHNHILRKVFLRDMAGEKFQAIQRGLKDMDHLLFCDFLFFCLDPMASASLRQAVTGERGEAGDDVIRDQERILSRIAQIIKDYKYAPPRLVVLLTKADEFRDKCPQFLEFNTDDTHALAAGNRYSLLSNWDHRLPVNEYRRYSRTVSLLLKDRLSQHHDLARFMTTVESFRDPVYLAISALGNPTRERGGKACLDATPQPMHVIDPIVHALDCVCDLERIQSRIQHV
jgi:hypothetical protein